jgi:hypothetical protein
MKTSADATIPLLHRYTDSDTEDLNATILGVFIRLYTPNKNRARLIISCGQIYSSQNNYKVFEILYTDSD